MYMDLKRQIALNVNTIRVMHKLTQKEFATKIGISTSLVSKIENAVHIPNAEIIKNICETFNVNCEWLIGININKKNLALEDILNLYAKLNLEQQKCIKNLMKNMN